MAGGRHHALAHAALLLAVSVLLMACTGGGAPHATVAPSGFIRTVRTLDVLGDSISLGVNACAQPGECPAASWAMGTDASVDSLATRIGRETGHRPEIANGAVSGGTVSSLLQSVPAVVAAEPQLVTILVGANDACRPSLAAMTSAADFRRDYRTALDRVLDALPHARVLTLSVPDLGRLGDACGSEDAARRVTEYNASIAALCSARSRCIGDGGAVHAQRFTSEDLSPIDRFHPSRTGQRKLAQLAWDALQRGRS